MNIPRSNMEKKWKRKFPQSLCCSLFAALKRNKKVLTGTKLQWLGCDAPAEVWTVLTHRPETNDLPWAERSFHTCLRLTLETWPGERDPWVTCYHGNAHIACMPAVIWHGEAEDQDLIKAPYNHTLEFLIIDPSRHITEPFCMNWCTGDYIAHIMWIINPPPDLRSALEISVAVVLWRLLQAGAVQ